MGNDETTATNSVGTTSTVLSVLVQETVVFFVKTDSVGDNKRSAAVVVEGSIEVVNSTETITTKSQRIGAQTETIFTDIESVLAEMRSVGISVRYNHLGE